MVTKRPLEAKGQRLRNGTAVMNRLFSNVYDLIANSLLEGQGKACPSKGGGGKPGESQQGGGRGT